MKEGLFNICQEVSKRKAKASRSSIFLNSWWKWALKVARQVDVRTPYLRGIWLMNRLPTFTEYHQVWFKYNIIINNKNAIGSSLIMMIVKCLVIIYDNREELLLWSLFSENHIETGISSFISCFRPLNCCVLV